MYDVYLRLGDTHPPVFGSLSSRVGSSYPVYKEGATVELHRILVKAICLTIAYELRRIPETAQLLPDP